MTLKYIGNGEYILGLPARDLSDIEVERYADSIGLTVAATNTLLISRGLYKTVSKTKASKQIKDSA